MNANVGNVQASSLDRWLDYYYRVYDIYVVVSRFIFHSVTYYEMIGYYFYKEYTYKSSHNF